MVSVLGLPKPKSFGFSRKLVKIDLYFLAEKMLTRYLFDFQVRVDRHATYLALAGGGLGSIAKIGVTNGLLMGFTVGTVTTGVLNSTLWKDKDLKKTDN